MRARFGPERVGLQTGDVSVDVQSSIVIMTTEILRNILYRAETPESGVTVPGNHGPRCCLCPNVVMSCHSHQDHGLLDCRDKKRVVVHVVRSMQGTQPKGSGAGDGAAQER